MPLQPRSASLTPRQRKRPQSNKVSLQRILPILLLAAFSLYGLWFVPTAWGVRSNGRQPAVAQLPPEAEPEPPAANPVEEPIIEDAGITNTPATVLPLHASPLLARWVDSHPVPLRRSSSTLSCRRPRRSGQPRRSPRARPSTATRRAPSRAAGMSAPSTECSGSICCRRRRSSRRAI